MLSAFNYRNGSLFAEDVELGELARQFGTPSYVYSRAAIEAQWRAFDDALAGREHLICFAVKANSNLAVLSILARLGSGFDIVSVGELERVLRAGGDPNKIVFSGVGKREDEIRRALDVGIYCFNVESESELTRINEVATALGKRAAVALRVNPDVDANTHPYISTGLKENKFGIAIEQAVAVYEQAAKLSNVDVVGVDCHIGSQLTETKPFVAALERVLVLMDRLAESGITLRHLNLGGGLGIRYRTETPPTPGDYIQSILSALGERAYKLMLEPGRAIVGNAGVMLTRVEYLKQSDARNFAIVDAAMNDLIRPALYGAWQQITAVTRRDGEARIYDVVGPVCETGDFLGKERALTIAPGDYLAVLSAGAYGFVMSSNYNTRPRAAEIVVDGNGFFLSRARETVEDLFAGERVMPA